MIPAILTYTFVFVRSDLLKREKLQYFNRNKCLISLEFI